jgi:hypothetical protein
MILDMFYVAINSILKSKTENPKIMAGTENSLLTTIKKLLGHPLSPITNK